MRIDKAFFDQPDENLKEAMKNITLTDVVSTEEPWKTFLIEKMSNAKMFKIYSPANRTVFFQGEQVEIKKGENTFPLELSLWLITKYGEGSDRTYGKTIFSDLSTKPIKGKKAKAEEQIEPVEPEPVMGPEPVKESGPVEEPKPTDIQSRKVGGRK